MYIRFFKVKGQNFNDCGRTDIRHLDGCGQIDIHDKQDERTLGFIETAACTTRSNIFCLGLDHGFTRIYSGGNDDQVIVHDIQTKQVERCGHVNVTVCPGSSDPFYVVTYQIKRVTTSWTYSTTHSIY